MKQIKFYKIDGPYGYFSNFFKSPIFLDGDVWPTVEHFFQASKFSDIVIRNRIRNLASPMDAAIEGRKVDNLIRTDWDKVKDGYMLKALRSKFFQHPRLKLFLLNTGEAELIEDTINDRYWGNGGDGSGKNRLGTLLMEVRSEIFKISLDNLAVFPPWIAFPEISQFDIFWRMGLGEDYLTEWSEHYLKLENKEVYQKTFPPIGDWSDIYAN